MTVYDYIIVGAGISGLYAGYKILKKNPNKNILILEAKKKKWVGGRMSNFDFYGVSVVTGAGIGRKDKDKNLIRLLKALRIPFSEFTYKFKFADTLPEEKQVNILEVLELLKKKFKTKSAKNNCLTFKEFAKPILGDKTYQAFLDSQPYTDFENEDAYETLYNYEMDDNIGGWTGMKVPWKRLVEKLASRLPILFGHPVGRISTVDECGFVVYTGNGRMYATKNVIIATTASTYRKLLPSYKIYDNVRGQPFLRLYGKFSGCSADVMETAVPISVIVPTPLKRIIPIDHKKGVYMLAYCDNDNARFFKEKLENTPDNRNFYCRLVEESLGIPKNTLRLTAIKDFYWPIATHYFTPLCGEYENREEFLDEAQHPMPGMLVVGEALSLNQGWTRGALESVDAVI